MHPDRIPARAVGAKTTSDRVRELEAAVKELTRERDEMVFAWADAQKKIIRLTAEVERLRASVSFIRRVW